MMRRLIGTICMIAIATPLLLCALLGALSPACAGVTHNDLVIAARALSFLENPPTGDVRVGIVYASGDPRSIAEAASLHDILRGGLRAGNLVLRPVMVRIDEVERAKVDLLFLTHGVGKAAARVAAVSDAKRIPCVTTDIAQVKRGTCVVGVRSEPRVEILVNRAAAGASGTTFSTAFRMLITEI